MRYLGIDYGKKKIGLAFGTDEMKIASPFGVIRHDENIVDQIRDVVKKEGIDVLVVGMPQGTGHEIVKYVLEVRNFADNIGLELGLPVVTFDESFTTAEANRLMRESNQKGADDAVAAMVMLQSYLDTF